MLARTHSLSAAMLTVKFIFVTNSESHAIQYHSLIMGCHLTAQIHYFLQIYRHCCPHHSQHVMDGFYLNGFRCVIYTWQSPGSARRAVEKVSPSWSRKHKTQWMENVVASNVRRKNKGKYNTCSVTHFSCVRI